MDIEKINKLNNQYCALVFEARELRKELGEPSRDEGLCYQNADIIAGQLATMSIGAEAQHWMREQLSCKEKYREVCRFLNPEAIAEKRKASIPGGASSSDSGASGAAGAQGAKGAPGKKKNDGLSDETVSKWFQPDPQISFDKDVVGMENLKTLLKNCVKDTAFAELNDYLGISSVRAFFFYGPPGCGKTHLVNAFAHELMNTEVDGKYYKYMKLESADIHSKFSGEADKIVKRAFQEAIDNEPCLLFIDEIDGVCQNRSMPNLSDFNMTLTTTFLTAFNDLIGARREHKNVIFIGATNYPANVDLGMLDRVELVQIPLPSDELRACVFSNLLKFIQLEDGLTYDYMAEQTEGYNQRDIDHVADHLRNLIRTEVVEKATPETAVAALESGEIRLTKAMFDKAMSMYRPAPKDEIEKSLNDFTNKMRNI